MEGLKLNSLRKMSTLSHLSSSWPALTYRDVSDYQWAHFNEVLPYMLPCALLHIIVRRRCTSRRARLLWDAGTGMFTTFIIHGPKNGVFVLALNLFYVLLARWRPTFTMPGTRTKCQTMHIAWAVALLLLLWNSVSNFGLDGEAVYPLSRSLNLLIIRLISFAATATAATKTPVATEKLSRRQPNLGEQKTAEAKVSDPVQDLGHGEVLGSSRPQGQILEYVDHIKAKSAKSAVKSALAPELQLTQESLRRESVATLLAPNLGPNLKPPGDVQLPFMPSIRSVIYPVAEQAYKYCLAVREESRRLESDLAAAKSDFVEILGYTLFTPLLISGPIITYDEYRRSLDAPDTIFSSGREITREIFGTATIWLCTEIFFCRLTYINALIWVPRNRELWERFKARHILFYGILAAVYTWCKLKVIWEIFGTWSNLAGVKAERNLPCFVLQTNSLRRFWRQWNTSFNKWSRIYIYEKLGGRSNRLWATMSVFAFSALWHRLSLGYTVWFLLSVLTFGFELSCARYFGVDISRPLASPSTKKFVLFVAIGAINGVFLLGSNLCSDFLWQLEGARHFVSVMISHHESLTTLFFLTFLVLTHAISAARPK